MSRKTSIVASMLVFAAGLAIETRATTNAYLISHWQTPDGLPENLVASVVQTRDGYLWVATFGGLARFDGLRFVTFGVHNSDAFPNNHIVNLYESHEGDLWIAFEYGGLVRFHLGQFTRYAGQQGLRSGRVIGFAEDNLGNLWVGGSGGLDRWQDGRFVADEFGKQLGNQEVQSIHSGRSGRVWILTSTGLYVIENGKLVPYHLPESVRGLGKIGDVQEDHSGHLWILGTDFATRLRLHELSGEQPEEEPIFRNSLSSFCEGSNGDVWFGSWRHGLFHWREGHGTNFDRIAGISDDQIRTIYEDREQNLWVGTTAGGLNRVRQRTIEIRSVTSDLADQDTLAVAEDSVKRLWVGTYDAGLFKSASGEFNRFLREYGPYDSSPISSVCPARDGSLWVGTWNDGLFRLKDGRVSQFDEKNGLSGRAVESVYEDKDGSLWVGTFDKGLNHFDGQKFTIYGATNGLDGNYFTCVLRTRDGTLWVGSEGWGVYRLVGGRFIRYGKDAGLSSNVVLAMYEDQEGHIWVGTQGDGGLNRWYGDHFVNFSRQSGLATDAIKQILEDDLENLWLGSNRGIIRVGKRELNDFVDGKASWLHAVTYGAEDGLSNIECRGGTQPAACKTSDGKLWFATHEGLVVIDPDRMISHKMPPPVVIERVLVDGRSVWPPKQSANSPLGSKREPVTFDVELARRDGGCEFQYTSPSLAAPEKIQFRYRLEGLDAGWTEAGSQRTAVYKYLPPGKYRFQVTACDDNGVWNEAGAVVTLFRPTPFWQTKSFLTVAGLVIILVSSGCVRWLTKRRMRRKFEELKRQHALERERSRIARDIHDDLGASLTKISKLTEIMNQRTGTQDLNRPLMQTIDSTANEAIRAIDEIVWAVNPKNDTLDDLAGYLVHFAEEFLRSTGVSFQLDVPLSLPQMPISAEIRHNLLMTVKEALNNAVKHGAPTKVRIGLKLEGNFLTIEVFDDGHGFGAVNGRPYGSGLENMRKRLDAVGGIMRLSGEPGLGTTVELRVDLLPSPRHQPIRLHEDQ